MADLTITASGTNNATISITVPSKWRQLHVQGNGISAIYSQRLTGKNGATQYVRWEGIPGMSGKITPIPITEKAYGTISSSAGSTIKNNWLLVPSDLPDHTTFTTFILVFEHQAGSREKFKANNEVDWKQTTLKVGNAEIHHVQFHSEDAYHDDKNDTYAELMFINDLK